MNRASLLALTFFILICCSIGAAGDTYLNITVSEVVYQNITYGEYFTLNETVKLFYIYGTLNITNPSNETINDISIAFENTAGMTSNFTHIAGRTGSHASGTPGEIMIVHVPELRPGNYSTFNYSINGTTVTPPLDLESNYTHSYVTKVLAGEYFNVTDKVTNQLWTQQTISNIDILIESWNVTWNTSIYNFTLDTLWETGNYVNVTNNSDRLWTWAANGGTLVYNQSANISYQVGAPIAVPTSATYPAIFQTLQYKVSYTASNLTVSSINATARALYNFTKRIAKPQDQLENHNVTWETDSAVYSDTQINYVLNNVTIWVTYDMNPANYTGITTEYLPNTRVNQTNRWTPTSPWYFNYTDGHNSTYPPPIIWMKPEYLIENAYGQIINQSVTVNGKDTYIKYIYVIHGYWLEVYKNVTSIGEDLYNITVWVHNKGNGWTPQYAIVSVYDFIPNDFAASQWNYGAPPNSQSTAMFNQTVNGSGFTGLSVRWDIGFIGGMNSSFGPDEGIGMLAGQNDTWTASYRVQGSGDYRVTDLYVVGLDPRQVDGASSSPAIKVIQTLGTYSSEMVFVLIVILLLGINLANFIMTSRIKKQLDTSGPTHFHKIRREIDDLKKRIK